MQKYVTSWHLLLQLDLQPSQWQLAVGPKGLRHYEKV